MEHRWVHEPLEETLDGARLLTVSVVDELMRDGWEQLAQVAGIPKRRWRLHHPVGDGPLVAIVDGRPAFDAAAWTRFASLVPGAVALRSRTAAMLGVAPGDVRPPGRPPLRLVDLWRARRLRRRLRKAERTLEADVATFEWSLGSQLDAMLGGDEVPFADLPSYALAARLDDLVDRTGRDWQVPVTIDLLNGDAIAQLLRLLVERGRSSGDALLEVASSTAGHDADVMPRHLASLDEIEAAGPRMQKVLMRDWLNGLGGWHAMRALLLEAAPLRDDPNAVQTWFDGIDGLQQREPRPADLADVDPALRDATLRARRLVGLRERSGHARADLHAALRAVTQTLAARLEADGALERADLAFDLQWRDLLRAARGVATSVAPITPRPDAEPDDAPAFTPELRGIPASAGLASGRVVVVEDPSLDAPVDGAVLVCRVTDPAWLPLMLRCAGLVTERGGPLSHAAIVARELGLPAVVGTRGAVAAGRAAALAHVDGSAGVVRLEPLG